MKINKLVITVLLLIGINTQTWSQDGTYLGVTGCITNDLYVIKDNSNYLKSVPLVSGAFGVIIRQELIKNSFLETGFNKKTYWQGFAFRGSVSYSTSTAFAAWIIPVRFGYRIRLIKKLFAVPVMGLSLGINEEYSNSGQGHGTLSFGQTTIEYNHTDNNGSSNIFILLNPMVNLELDIKSVQLGIYVERSYGLNTTNQLDITYTVNGSQPIKATSTSKGQYWCYGSSTKYKLSNLWKKK